MKILIEQFIKEHEIDYNEFEDEAIEIPERFSYIIKFEREVSKGNTKLKISYRDTRIINMDYKIIHETNNKKDYKKFVNFFTKQGYYKL